MSPERPDPFTLVFGDLAEERFPALQASLAAAGIDPLDRDAFLLDRAVTELLREVVPEDAPSESLHEFLAVLQHGFLFWRSGKEIRSAEGPTGASFYFQLPSHLYWGQLEPGAPHEPLDGFFLYKRGGSLHALGIFGMHPDRPGFGVSEVEGPRPTPLPPRTDGSAPYAPLMEGGVAAGLRSVAGPDELLALAWTAHG